MNNWRLWLALPLTITMLWGAALAQPTAAPVIPDEVKAADANLGAEQASAVDEFLRYHGEQLAALARPNERTAVALRKAVIEAYQTGSGAGYRRYFADSAARNFASPALQAKLPAAQVNAALALASLREPAIIPALRQMVQHDNPAVRYAGMKAYVELRPLLVQLGGQALEQFLQTLQSRAAAENSPVVLLVMFRVLDFSATGELANASVSNLSAAQARGREALLQAARAHLAGVRNADPAVLGAFVEFAQTARAAARWDARASAQVLQAMADLMKNAAQAYLEAFEAYRARRTPVPEDLPVLLRTLESALSAATNSGQSMVADALSLPDLDATKGRQVLLRVNEWVGTEQNPGILQRHGVQPPEALPPGGVSTQPAAAQAVTTPARP